MEGKSEHLNGQLEANMRAHEAEQSEEESVDLTTLPEKPLYLEDLPAEQQQEFFQLHRECFPEMWRLYSEEEIRDQLGSCDVRLFMSEPTSEESDHIAQVAAKSPWWLVGTKSRVFIGEFDLVQFLLFVGKDNGWTPADPDTQLESNFAIPMGPNDALALARILRARLQENGEDSRARWYMEAVIALLMEGPATFTPGPEPENQDLLSSKPSRTPFLRVVK